MLKKLFLYIFVSSLVFFAVAYGVSYWMHGHGDVFGSLLFAGIFGLIQYLFMLNYLKKKK